MQRITTVAFTGHRFYCGEADLALRQLLRSLYEEGARTFLSGMAVGFDMAAAEAVIELRREHPDVELVAVLPFAEQARRFSTKERERHARLVQEANQCITLAPTYYKGCYQLRNRYLVEHAATLVAWYNGSSGGTRQTFLSALHRGLRVENLGLIRLDPQLF
ncbi:MAG: DUF1273 family protein [Alistipes sp.]|nr:DUF1273 domain-containing protein [Rikenellaceae bacterium]MBQ2727722.1 DUF1273 family protein [Alistipes sp.]MBQ3083363.1 DUF1273 family protein [Alistipes sp.]MBQ8470404.1 DUF1273 family protein [Alistipes sp.]